MKMFTPKYSDGSLEMMPCISAAIFAVVWPPPKYWSHFHLRSGTQYAADARLKIDLVNDHLAGKEMEIGRFYQKTGQWLASEIRFRNVIENYQTTSHAPEALYRLTESSLALGIPAEAKKYAAVLGANYPGSKWYERAYTLIGDEAPQLIGAGG